MVVIGEEPPSRVKNHSLIGMVITGFSGQKIRGTKVRAMFQYVSPLRKSTTSGTQQYVAAIESRSLTRASELTIVCSMPAESDLSFAVCMASSTRAALISEEEPDSRIAYR